MNSWLNLVSMTMALLLTVYSRAHSGVVMKLCPGQQQVLWSVQRRWWILEAHRSRSHSCFINRNCRQYAHGGFWGSVCWYLYPALHVRPPYKTWASKRRKNVIKKWKSKHQNTMKKRSRTWTVWQVCVTNVTDKLEWGIDVVTPKDDIWPRCDECDYKPGVRTSEAS